MKPVLVTGAAGRIGSFAVRELLDAGRSVRAAVRSLDERSDALARLGAEIVVADLYDPIALQQAMHDVRSVLFIPPWQPHMIQAAAAVAVAARAARVESIVVLSQWLASASHPSLSTRQHWLADNLFAMMPDTAVTIVNPGFFADNYLNAQILMFAAHLGIMPMPIGDSRNAPPSNEDIARVAAAVVMDPFAHDRRHYRPTGPELLSGQDIADIVGSIFGRGVRQIDLPLPMFLKAARLAGYDEFFMHNLQHYIAEHRRGTFAMDAPSRDVFAVTGRQPESFETIARRYVASPRIAPALEPGIPNLLKTFGAFARIGMSRFDVGRYERGMNFPTPARPSLAPDDRSWHELPVLTPARVALEVR